MLNKFLIPCFGVLISVGAQASELVIAENGKSDYQIIIPAKSGEDVVDNWLLMSAKLMQVAFAKNGSKIEVVAEGVHEQGKPGIFLGSTGFAKQSGIKFTQEDDWTYYHKVVGRNIIIAGHDRKDPARTVKGTKTPLAQLGTVKGVCDFLRDYAGVRFLFLNMEQGMYAMRNGRWDAFSEDGSLKVDTRSIAFIPVARIAVPEKLNIKKTPVMQASCDSANETFYYIAMNFFPMLSSVLGSDVCWFKAVPPAEYAKSHPEYFALTKDGKRACDLKLAFDSDMQYCVVNRGVQDLMFKEVEKLITGGEKTISISTLDAYQLCRCNCEECNRFFGVRAESWDQIHARGDSGRLWQAYFMITERIRKKYPDVKIVLLNYQDTPVSIKVIKKFPKNVIVKIQFASQFDFDRLHGVEFPAGICGFEETFTGFGQAGPYLPERTPEHIAGVVQTMARNNVKWSTRDGSIGYVRGLQAPAYYVYGRMMDDPSADWKSIYSEFCTAAFGSTAPQMTRFFDLLHMQIAIYSDFLGVFMPAWNRKYSRSTYHDSKWHVMSMYTPEYCADADALLTSAEKAASDPDIKARLHLVRIEFDYIRKMSRIFFLQNAWTMNPSRANQDPLVDAIDDWHGDLEELAGGTGRSSFKPLSDWPEMRPFSGHFYSHAALQSEGYQQQWNKTCLNWDTKAIRAGILTDRRQLKITTVETVPGIDSKAWNNVPASFFKDNGGMPFANVRTTMKILCDRDNLYIRVESLNPSKHPEDLFKKEPDGNIFVQEYVELGIMPPDSGGKIFRIAASPVEGARYDSIFMPVNKKRVVEDVKWNGKWEFAFGTNMAKGQWNQPERIWTAWFRIPFSDLGAKMPSANESWGFNAARNRTGRYMTWSDARSVTDEKALGQLIF